jgi:hypothetical protein
MSERRSVPSRDLNPDAPLTGALPLELQGRPPARSGSQCTAEALLGLPPLRPGEIVRVRLRGECPGYWLSFFKQYKPHFPGDDGQMAVVAEVDAGHDCGAPSPCGHDYMLLVSSNGVWIGPYARTELERVHP